MSLYISHYIHPSGENPVASILPLASFQGMSVMFGQLRSDNSKSLCNDLYVLTSCLHPALSRDTIAQGYWCVRVSSYAGLTQMQCGRQDP